METQDEVTEPEMETNQQEMLESVPGVPTNQQEMLESIPGVPANQQEMPESVLEVPTGNVPEICVSPQEVCEITNVFEMREETTEEIVGKILSSLISQVVGEEDHTPGYLDPTQSITQQILDSPSKDKYQVLV